MKKIGFVDLFIDEWHANNYPQFIKNSRFKDAFEVAYAWEEAPKAGGRPLAQWCQDFGVKAAASITEVVRKSDCIIVLAPSNPEVHERLSKLPLRSGKPVYIDKPFAPSLKAARRMIERARAHQTPMFSSSALRFGSGLNKMIAELGGPAAFASTRGGGGSFEEYAIHQIEMLVMLMGHAPKRLMQCGAGGAETLVVEFADGRRCTASYAPGFSFQAESLAKDGTCRSDASMGDFFPRFIDAMLEFFETGKPPFPAEQSLAVAAILETAIKAKVRKDKWFKVPAIT